MDKDLRESPVAQKTNRPLGCWFERPGGTVGEPQCNGVIERFMRTLKEQCLWLHRFDTLDQAQAIISAFIERYNHEWLIERLEYRTPATARREMLALAA